MKLKKIALFVTTTLALFTAIPRVSADSNVQKVIDETYVKPDYVLGYSLDQSQIEQTLSLLNYDSSKDKEEWKTMTPEVYSSIMNVANDDSLELYSSVKIQKLGKNKPLEVNFAVNLSKSSVISSKSFTKTLSDLKDSIVDKAGDTFNNINLNFDTNAILKDSGNFFTNAWNAIAGFFGAIWNAIVKFFSGLVG